MKAIRDAARSPAGAGALGRRFSVGAEPSGRRTHVRVWAPARRQVSVAHGPSLEERTALALEPKDGWHSGWHSGWIDGLEAGGRYAFLLDGDSGPYPDPASRFQPEGPHGPSEVVDPTAFDWTDARWPGPSPRGQVLYELHVGTFTPEGTLAAAAGRLELLADLGVTVVELMPLAEFAGRFGWGYDGVDLWAPSHLYGRPDDLRRFVDGAHRLGLGVILDVVYNHLGPDGNTLGQFSPDYFTDRYDNEWGDAINFDGPGAGPVRAFFADNAAYWVSEFHLDGLRLDATQQIFDGSREHIVAEVARRARAAASGRRLVLVAENEPQDARVVRPLDGGGYGLDAIWNDDFHHTCRVALSGHDEAYYSDYGGTPQELVSAVRWGFLYQGQRYAWQHKRRGTPSLDLPGESFVHFLENHDQVANSAQGARLVSVAAPGALRALTALLLLGPATPMLFQGQEFGSTRPFRYFADHRPELAAAIEAGRREFLSQFPGLASIRSSLPAPGAEDTFAACKLDWSERERHPEALALHRDLVRLRRSDPVFSATPRERIAGAVLSADALVLRFEGAAGARLLLVNLGLDLTRGSMPEPLLAPPAGQRWRVLWSSEDVRYGGEGTGPIENDEGLRLPGRAAVVLAPQSLASPSLASEVIA
jgi:maltooligosyltrehalose trehalohydrolase